MTGSPVLARVNQSAALSRMAARHRQICGRAGEKAAAEREIDAGLLDRREQRRDGRGGMLAVGVERDERIRTPLEGVVDAGLQRGALSEVDRMPDDDRACEQRDVAGAVAGAVIDHDDRVSGAANAGHDAADHRRFIVRGDNDPGIANLVGHSH